MADYTGIAWVGDEERMGATWNPWVGCSKISEKRPTWEAMGSACDNCYAMTNAEPKHRGRMQKTGQPVVPLWGPDGVRRQCTSTWTAPIAWNKKATEEGRRLRVFVSSMGDLFETHKTIKDEWRNHAFQLVRQCPQIDFLLLTKRPGSIAKMVPADWLSDWATNCWIGTTVEHAGNVRRITDILSLSGNPPVRFLSCEPLLGPLDLRPYLGAGRINWVIVAGESGAEARRTDPDWVRDIRDQCAEAEVAFFYKQPGTRENVSENKKIIHDMVNSKKTREQWKLDGVAHWNWPLPSVSKPQQRKPGRPTNLSQGLSPALDDKARQARRRSMARHKTDGGWDDLIARWLEPLPIEQRQEAATALRTAISKALKKP